MNAKQLLPGLVSLIIVLTVVSHSMAAVVLGLVWISIPFTRGTLRRDWHLMVPAIFLCVAVAWSTITTLGHGLSLEPLGKYYYYTPVAVLPLLVLSPDRIRKVFSGAAALSAAVIFFCYLLYTFDQVPPFLSRIYWGDRLAAFLSHPISAAGVFSFLSLLSISMIFLADTSRSTRVLLGMSTLVNSFGLILTQSRSFLIAYPIVVITMIVHSRNRKMLIAGGLTVLLATVYLGFNIESFQRIFTVFDLKNFQSNYERLAMWEVAFKVGTESWSNLLFGIGYGGWRVGAADYFARYLPEMAGVAHYKHVHNILLNTFVETGAVGLGIYVGFVVSLIRTLTGTLRQRTARSLDRAFAYGALMSLVCYQIAGLVDYLHMPDILLPTYLFITLGYALPTSSGHPRKDGEDGAHRSENVSDERGHVGLGKGASIPIFVSFSGDGGVERVVSNLARGFASRGYAVDLLLAKARGGHASNLPAGVTVRKLGPDHTILCLPHLVRYLTAYRPEVMITAKRRGNITAILARWLARVPTKLFARVDTTVMASLRRKSVLERYAYLLPLKWFYRFAERIVCVSQGVADDLVSAGLVSPALVHVIHNPVLFPGLEDLAAKPVDHPWFGDGGPPVIVAAGRLTEQKDFPTLLRAVARVRKRRPCRLIILGEGALRKSLTDQAKELGIQDSLSMPGFVTNPYAVMAKADLFALSSAWEGLPTALIEAMAVGTPVVSTDCPSGPREILNNGEYGQIVPVGAHEELAEAIVATLDHPPAPDLLQSACERYTIDRVVDEHIRMFETATARDTGSP